MVLMQNVFLGLYSLNTERVTDRVIVFTLPLKFSLITIELEPDVLINGVLYDSCDGFMIKGIVAYLNYGHMHACDNYYTKCT